MLILITQRTSSFRRLAVRLSVNGVFSYVSSFEAARFICEKKDTGGVVLDCTQSLPMGEKLCESLRNEYPDMPIAAIVPLGSIPNMPATRILTDCDKDTLLEELMDFCTRACGWSTERLSTYHLTVNDRPDDTRYMGYRLPLSVRQHIILRCLFYRAPKPTTVDDLMSLCFPEGVQSGSNLAVQIKRINDRAKRIDHRPLIVFCYGEGYRLRDGIL